VAFSSGALVVQKPQEYGGGWSAFWLLDERSDTGWATPKGVISNQTAVIELPDRSILKTLEFDTAHTENPGRGAKDITVEMSDTSMQTGFQKIADVSLQPAVDGQKFPVQAEVPGRWVRLTFHNNQGDPDYLELMEFKAHGQRVTQTSLTDISGTYNTTYGDMHIRQQGTSVVGCYEHAEGLLEGGIEGRVMKLTWHEAGHTTPEEGPAVMVFSSDGKQLFGLWWFKGQENSSGNIWNGPKTSNTVGTCPHWKGGVEQQMASDLEQSGKVRVYGINFDTDSDKIRDESHTTLDQIVAMLKAKPDWKLTVEGHTDATSTPEHNQQLSERRATSVKAYLVGAGIDASRLSTAGYGATKPVASNDTELGRAQNRRVELVKM
jgi:outer membrane protein OmpA-like peptidoglycan-associated protein